MIFAILMTAAAVAATILIGIYGGGFWGALAFSGLLVLAYRAIGSDAPPPPGTPRHGTNAFQKWASKD